MSRLTFKRITPEESRICQLGICIGDVRRQDDLLNPGTRYYLVHLDEDYRSRNRVHKRHRNREVPQAPTQRFRYLSIH